MENPYCNGIEGILEAYHQSLRTVQLYGPTNFAPVVNHVARSETTTEVYLLKQEGEGDGKHGGHRCEGLQFHS